MSCSASSARPLLTLSSSRARANSSCPPPNATDDDDDDDDSHDNYDDNLPPDFVSRSPSPQQPFMLGSFFTLFSPKKDRSIYSLSSSQTTSIDSLSLPLPASPQQASFGADVWQQDGHFRTGGRPTSRESLSLWSVSSSTLTPIILTLLIFPLSTALMLACLFSLPINASFPHTLSELSALGHDLQVYADSGFRPMAHVLGVLSITALWKHAWSVPGSVLLNVLAGVLMSPLLSTILMTTLTAVGSMISTLLATPLAPIISQIFPKALTLTRNALEGGDTFTASPKDRTPGWVRLSVLRLIGVVPWSGINIACGVTGVALTDCLLSSFIGTLPWTAVTCQVGDIMQTVAASTSSADAETLASLLHSPTVVFKLAFLTLVSLVPILARDRLRSLLGRSVEEGLLTERKVIEDAKARRSWWHLRRKAAGGNVMEMDSQTDKGMVEKNNIVSR